MNCKKCGNNLNSGDKFCPRCGQPVENGDQSSFDNFNQNLSSLNNNNQNIESLNVTQSIQNNIVSNLEQTPSENINNNQLMQDFNVSNQQINQNNNNLNQNSKFASIIKNKKLLIIIIAILFVLVIGLLIAFLTKNRETDILQDNPSNNITDTYNNNVDNNISNNNSNSNNNTTPESYMNDPELEDNYTVSIGETLKVREPGQTYFPTNNFDLRVDSIDYGTFANGAYSYAKIDISGTNYDNITAVITPYFCKENCLAAAGFVLNDDYLKIYDELTEDDISYIKTLNLINLFNYKDKGNFSGTILLISINYNYEEYKIQFKVLHNNKTYYINTY